MNKRIDYVWALVDVLAQATTSIDESGVVHDLCISSYEHACKLLESDGYAKEIGKGTYSLNADALKNADKK